MAINLPWRRPLRIALRRRLHPLSLPSSELQSRSSVHYAERGEPAPLEDRLIFKFQAAQRTTRGADLGMKLYRVVGGTGLFVEHPFEPHGQRPRAARQHQFDQDFSFCANIGAVAMGKENTDFFV